MKKRGRSKGFTLIELLVVIAIIGLLASIILASLNTAQQKGRDARRLSDINELQTALELYSTKHGSYPNTLSGLVSDGDISSLPTDPRSGLQYAYAARGALSSCNSYHLAAVLENQGSYTGVASTHSAICTNGGYSGGASNGDGVALGAINGDFNGGVTIGSGTDYVYDVTP